MRVFWPLVGLVFLLTIFNAYIIFTNKSKKIGFVNNVELYNNFLLKKELNEKLNHQVSEKQKGIDSFYAKIQNSRSNQIIYDNLIQSFREERKKFEEFKVQQTKTFNAEVWNHLNQYVIDYGKEKNYDLILGALGNGSLMYADSANDLTRELIDFTNKKYEGDIK